MVKFLVKSVLLISLLFLLAWGIRTALDLPYAWVTDRMHVRSHELFTHPNKYNTVFIGSSKTFRGIKPWVFDDYVNANSSKKLTSINFGLGGATIGRIYGMCDDLIESEEVKPKYIFFELRSLQTSWREKSFKKNLHTKRAVLWTKDWNALLFSWRSLWGMTDEEYTFWKKVRYTRYFFQKFIQNKLNIGMVKDMIARKWTPPNEEELGNRGFEATENGTEKGLERQRKKFMKEPKKAVKNARDKSIIYFSDQTPNKNWDTNQGFVSELIKLAERAEERNIKIYYVLYPMLKPGDYINLKPTYAALPNRFKINITNGQKYPEFYKVENCWDDTHANTKGATLLSKAIAEAFVKKTSKTK